VTSTPFPVRPRRDVLVVEGPDAARYLQGQVSQDVEGLAVGDRAWSLILQPQGKVDAWFRLERTGDEAFRLDVDAGFGEALVARLTRFLIRTDAAVRLDATEVELDHPPSSEADRIAAGVPAMGAELDDRTIPAEVGQWFVDASVSFTKGCYTGQELVARIDSRGSHVPRLLRTLEVDGGVEVEVGAEVVVDGAVVGTVTSSAPGLALAFIRRAVEPPAVATVALAAEGTPVTATIR